VPKQFVLAYFRYGYSNEPLEKQLDKIEFFIDPTTGQVFTHKDMESYFKRISVPSVHAYFKPFSNKRVIQSLLEEMSKCFDEEKTMYKKKELLQLATLLD
jgi:hypothetical protein